jgi:hypothetical protein
MNIFFQWLSGLISIFLYVFPSSDPNTEALILNSTVWLRQFMVTAGYFFPVTLFLQYLGFIILVESIIIASKLVGWILHNVTLGFFKRL